MPYSKKLDFGGTASPITDGSTVHVQVGLSSKRVGDRWCALATILVLKE